METLSPIAQDLLGYFAEGHIGLWMVVRVVQRELQGPHEDEDVKRAALAALHELMSEGLISAGIPDANGTFNGWDLSPDQTVARVGKEWDALGNEPNIGEVAWFTATSKGIAAVGDKPPDASRQD